MKRRYTRRKLDWHPNAVLNEQQVAEIRWLWEHNSNERHLTQDDLARRYGVSRGCITGIVYYYNWSDTEPAPPQEPDSEDAA